MQLEKAQRVSEMASLLEVAGFSRDAVYRACVHKVKAVVVHHGPFEPPVPGEMSAVQQSVRGNFERYKLGWHGGGDGGKLAFLRSAKSLPHLAQDEPEQLPADRSSCHRYGCAKARGNGALAWQDASAAA